MKKITILVATILTVIMATGCFQKLTTYQEIDFKTLNKKFKQKEDFVLFIGSSQCSHCQSYKPKLEAVIKVHQIKVYYIDVYALTAEESKQLESYITFSGTPYTVFIENGKLKENGDDKQVYSISGDRDIDYIKKIFVKNGYMKE